MTKEKGLAGAAGGRKRACDKMGKGVLALVACAARCFKASIALALLLLVCYFLLSYGSLFIGKSQLVSLSLNAVKPFNIISYMVVHMSVWHLAVNLVSLLLFAAVVEAALSPRDAFGIFFFSGMATGALFSLLNPGIALIGASAGVCGLMASAFVLNARQSLAVLGIVVVVFLLAFPLFGLLVQGEQHYLVQKNVELGSVLSNAIKSGDEEKVKAVAGQKAIAEAELKSFSESKNFASGVEIDPFLHSYAAIFGVVYLLAFRRKQTMAAVKKQRIPFFGKRTVKKAP